jgi:hypothetical protein
VDAVHTVVVFDAPPTDRNETRCVPPPVTSLVPVVSSHVVVEHDPVPLPLQQGAGAPDPVQLAESMMPHSSVVSAAPSTITVKTWLPVAIGS